MLKLSTYCAATAIACVLVSSACRADELADAIQADPEVPQLKALEGYIGKFDVQVTTEELRHIRGEVEAKWILRGRYLEQTMALRTDDQGAILTTRTMMTYDAKAGKYRQWLFASDGSVATGDGTWNDARKIMTWTTNSDDKVLRTVADFSQKEFETWQLTVAQPTGQVELEVRGTNTVRK